MEKIDKRTRILTAAEKLFAEQGFEGTSTRQIAMEAKANMAMINYYFGSKDGVFMEVMTNSMKEFNLQLVSINEDKVSHFEKLTRVIDRYAQRIMNNIPFHRMIHHEFSLNKRPEIYNKIRESFAINLNIIEGIINEGIKEGSFRSVDVRMLIATVMGTISNVAVFPSKITSGSKLDINIPQDHKIISDRLVIHLKDLIKTYLTPQK